MPEKQELKNPQQKTGYVNIAQSLLEQISKAGQPRVTTTTTETPEEPLNILNLGFVTLLLLENILGNKKKQDLFPESDFSRLYLSTQQPVLSPSALSPLSSSGRNLASVDPYSLLNIFSSLR